MYILIFMSMKQKNVINKNYILHEKKNAIKNELKMDSKWHFCNLKT